jgi:ABC-type multidrug transport system ATPase subunit
LRSSGVTIMLTTPDLEESQVMADRVGIINHG